MKEKEVIKLKFATYEFSMTCAGILIPEERDEIDTLRQELHGLFYRFTRKNMDILEEQTRAVATLQKK